MKPLLGMWLVFILAIGPLAMVRAAGSSCGATWAIGPGAFAFNDTDKATGQGNVTLTICPGGNYVNDIQTFVTNITSSSIYTGMWAVSKVIGSIGAACSDGTQLPLVSLFYNGTDGLNGENTVIEFSLSATGFGWGKWSDILVSSASEPSLIQVGPYGDLTRNSTSLRCPPSTLMVGFEASTFDGGIDYFKIICGDPDDPCYELPSANYVTPAPSPDLADAESCGTPMNVGSYFTPLVDDVTDQGVNLTAVCPGTDYISSFYVDVGNILSSVDAAASTFIAGFTVECMNASFMVSQNLTRIGSNATDTANVTFTKLIPERASSGWVTFNVSQGAPSIGLIHFENEGPWWASVQLWRCPRFQDGYRAIGITGLTYEYGFLLFEIICAPPCYNSTSTPLPVQPQPATPSPPPPTEVPFGYTDLPDNYTLAPGGQGGKIVVRLNYPPYLPSPHAPPNAPGNSINPAPLAASQTIIQANLALSGVNLYPPSVLLKKALVIAFALALGTDSNNVTFVGAKLDTKRRHLLELEEGHVGRRLLAHQTISATMYIATASTAAVATTANTLGRVIASGAIATSIANHGGPQVTATLKSTSALFPEAVNTTAVAPRGCTNKFGHWCLDNSKLTAGSVSVIIGVLVVVLCLAGLAGFFFLAKRKRAVVYMPPFSEDKGLSMAEEEEHSNEEPSDNTTTLPSVGSDGIQGQTSPGALNESPSRASGSTGSGTMQSLLSSHKLEGPIVPASSSLSPAKNLSTVKSGGESSSIRRLDSPRGGWGFNPGQPSPGRPVDAPKVGGARRTDSYEEDRFDPSLKTP